MPPVRKQWFPADQGSDDKTARLSEENAQLKQAVESHAVIDQAIGVLIAVWRVPPAAGWEALVKVSQHCNVKLHAVAENVIGWALGEQMPSRMRGELETAVGRWRQDPPRSGRRVCGE
jgi:hypothetical protein